MRKITYSVFSIRVFETMLNGAQAIQSLTIVIWYPRQLYNAYKYNKHRYTSIASIWLMLRIWIQKNEVEAMHVYGALWYLCKWSMVGIYNAKQVSLFCMILYCWYCNVKKRHWNMLLYKTEIRLGLRTCFGDWLVFVLRKLYTSSTVCRTDRFLKYRKFKCQKDVLSDTISVDNECKC